MIDFSHANSSKQHRRQIVVGQDVGGQIAAGDRRIIGAMIESHLVEGRQDYRLAREDDLRPKRHRPLHWLGGHA